MISYVKLSEHKYLLTKDYNLYTGLFNSEAVESRFISLTKGGHLKIKKGFEWNGATGMKDTPPVMRGSLVHDTLYRLIREKKIPKYFRKQADKQLVKIFLEDGMSKLMSKFVYIGVRLFGNLFSKYYPY